MFFVFYFGVVAISESATYASYSMSYSTCKRASMTLCAGRSQEPDHELDEPCWFDCHGCGLDQCSPDDHDVSLSGPGGVQLGSGAEDGCGHPFHVGSLAGYGVRCKFDQDWAGADVPLGALPTSVAADRPGGIVGAGGHASAGL